SSTTMESLAWFGAIFTKWRASFLSAHASCEAAGHFSWSTTTCAMPEQACPWTLFFRRLQKDLALSQSTSSFCQTEKETAASKWARTGARHCENVFTSGERNKQCQGHTYSTSSPARVFRPPTKPFEPASLP